MTSPILGLPFDPSLPPYSQFFSSLLPLNFEILFWICNINKHILLPWKKDYCWKKIVAKNLEKKLIHKFLAEETFLLPFWNLHIKWVEQSTVIFTVEFAEWLKSVNSNFSLAVHSPKLNQVKTHFLSHHNICNINRFTKFRTRDLWSNG